MSSTRVGGSEGTSEEILDGTDGDIVCEDDGVVVEF